MVQEIQEKELTPKQVRLRKMIKQISTIIKAAKIREEEAKEQLNNIHPNYRKSAINLLHYQAFREFDLRDLQKKLGYLGLSRLAKSQLHVMASLLTTRAILKAICNGDPIKKTNSELSFKQGQRRLTKNAKHLLGKRRKGRRTRIMVTMPSVAAEQPQLVYDLLKAGMNCARVNCAHDSPEVWEKIIGHIRDASEKLGKECKIAMDLAGPKIRTGPIVDGPKIKKIKPIKNNFGQVNQPLKIWLGSEPNGILPHIPLAKNDLEKLNGIESLYFRDTRNKKRAFEIIEKKENGFIAHCSQTTFIETGLKLFTDKKRKGDFLEVDEITPIAVPLILSEGDILRLDKIQLLGENALKSENGEILSVAHISCTSPLIFEQVEVGEKILFDDGKIEGKINEITDEHLFIEITFTAGASAKLRADKGINLPDSKLTISGLTEKDKRDLPFVVKHADVINFSFVNRPQDVQELFEELKKLDAENKLGIVLKIETKSGFNQLAEILLEAMQAHSIGVMIARGDLAIESGWQNIGRVQEEILSICQSAHISDIWATQVLEGLAKTGLPSRAEITDAVMSQRADCVMLNKGPYIIEAVKLLNVILSEMEAFWEKNAPYSPKIKKQKAKPENGLGVDSVQFPT